MDLFELFILLMLVTITPVEAYTALLQNFRFPHTPASRGVYYIHSPEVFLHAHGLCGPGFVLESAEKPAMSGDYASISMTYRTLWEGRMHARVFSNDANMSQFLLVDDKGRECVMGQLRLRRLERGFGLRCFATRLRAASLWDILVVPPAPLTEYIESAVTAAVSRVREDVNLGAYRRMVMRPR